MKENIKYIFKNLRSYLQNKNSSYEKHHDQYDQPDSLRYHREIYKKYHNDVLINNPNNNVIDFLDQHNHLKTTAIDIGCGGGWACAELSKRFEYVIGIEPSSSALNIAKDIYPSEVYPNISWINDFAEEALDKLSFEQPVFLFSGCVLSHLTDEAVINITAKISKITTSGSGLSLCENWGKEFHDYMWHVRTTEWWQNNLPGWNINFHGPSIEGKSNRFQGIHGIKK